MTSPVLLVSIHSREPGGSGALLVIVAGTWEFAALADEVTEGETQRFDNRIAQRVRFGSYTIWIG